MQFRTLAAALAVISFALATPGTANAAPKLQIPNFSDLRAKAVESTDITIGRPLLSLARKFVGDDDDDEALAFFKGIKSVRVRSFTFNEDGAYSKSDIDAVRSQLSGPGWSSLVQIHKRDPQQDVDVFLCLEDGKASGLAIISSEAREFTIVNIVGDIDLDKLGSLDGQFGIPRVTQNP